MGLIISAIKLMERHRNPPKWIIWFCIVVAAALADGTIALTPHYATDGVGFGVFLLLTVITVFVYNIAKRLGASVSPNESLGRFFWRAIRSKSFQRMNCTPGGDFLQISEELVDKMASGTLHAWGREIYLKAENLGVTIGSLIEIDAHFWKYGRLTLNLLYSERGKSYASRKF